MAYDLAVLDFDGTLADSAGWLRGVLNGVARRYGFREVSDEEFALLRGRDNRAIVRHLGVPAWKMPLIARHMRGLMARDADRISLFPGTPGLLARLDAAGVAIAVVSSNSEENVRRILGPENAARVSLYACGASVFGKASKMRRVLRAARVPGERALGIGDEVRDIEAAAGAGLRAGAVAWGYATPELLAAHRPAHLFRTMDEVAEAFGA